MTLKPDKQTIDWLRRLADKGGKGVVNNIDARSLGRIADSLESFPAWQPIETAPMDGTPVLVWNASGSWCGGWAIIKDDDGESYGATHWQPLPEPPK